MKEREASRAVILVMGTTRTIRSKSPDRNRSTPLITEYFFTCHCATAIAITVANSRAFTHQGAPPRIVRTRNGIADRAG